MAVTAGTGMHDPNAVLDYGFNWTGWLDDGDTISTFEVIVDGVTLDSATRSGSVITAWISGGTVGRRATVTCRITTTEGRTDDRTLYLTIAER